jgi:ribosome maturation factor RimP
VVIQAGLEGEIEALLAKAGMRLLTFSVSQRKGNVKVTATIFSPSGTGTEECAKASRLIEAELRRTANIQEPEIEVSSPGIDRTIRTSKEWQAFEGQQIKLLLVSENEWRSGKLGKYWGNRIDFIENDISTAIEISAIAKAKLDSSYKGE